MPSRRLLLAACALMALGPASAFADQPQPQRPSRHAAPPAWRRGVRGAERVRAGRWWREHNRHWDRRAPWRRSRWWWRHHHAFRLYAGPRVGFFFVPAFGYIAYPPAYVERRWNEGEQLPAWRLRYQIADYAAYGLPRPPEGCAWVWVGHDVALVDLDDGFIIDIVRNVW